MSRSLVPAVRLPRLLRSAKFRCTTAKSRNRHRICAALATTWLAIILIAVQAASPSPYGGF